MKKLSLSRQILYALVILLLVINIVTVLSVIRFIGQHKSETIESVSGEEVAGSHRTKFFSDELNLDDDQQLVFRELNREYNQTANQIYRDLSHSRIDLVDEMGRSTPDTLNLHALSKEIGGLHAELKMLTTDFYLGMKAVCSAEQKVILFNLFKGLLNEENELGTPRGRGSGGRGYGRQKN